MSFGVLLLQPSADYYIVYKVRRDKHGATDLIWRYTFNVKYMQLISHNAYKDTVQHGKTIKNIFCCVLHCVNGQR